MLASPILIPPSVPPAMHIPDGYLSPVISLILFLLMLPFWYFGVRKLRQTMNARSVPLIALVAAFSFVIMMFNVPLPGGTTGHAVGGALAAIVLGPEVASIAISIALIIQAFLFGDGGILAIGANCFNMAVVLPYVSYGIYRAIGSKSDVKSVRRIVGTVLGGVFGVLLALNVETIVPFIEHLFHVEFLSADVYYISELPSDLQWPDVVRICGVSVPPNGGRPVIAR